MRIYSKLVYEPAAFIAGRYVIDESASEWCDYDGPIAECKGAGTAQAQLNTQNQLVQQELQSQQALQQQVMGSSATPGSIASYLSGNVGFSPQALASMTSQFLNQNTSNFNQAGQAVMSQLASRGAAGGAMPVGGDFTRGLEALQGARASSQAQGILGLNVQNAQQALSNQFNAANIGMGQAAQVGQNLGTFNQGASSALNSYVTAANSSPLMNMLGQALGAGIGGFTGGIGATIGKNMMGGGGSCWIAEVLYGTFDQRTFAARRFVNGGFSKRGFGRIFAAAYRTFGERVARFLAKHPALMPAFRIVFDKFAARGKVILEIERNLLAGMTARAAYGRI